ncbi:MAG: RNA polymerase sigma factor [Gemmatimonadota bacterium]|nr:RNA polymerase sigma factor [Gemmatimonadota bacterium]
METALKLDGRIASDHQEENMEIDSARDRTDLEDRRLILKARGGDVRALEELVYRYDEKVLSMAMSFVGDMDDAKDIYQEVFIRVLKALPKFEFRSRFSTYLYRIVTNVCLTHRTRDGKRRFVPIEDEQGEDQDSTKQGVTLHSPDRSDAAVINHEIASRIRTAVSTLSPRLRTVFVLRHQEGFKLREIAGIMECAEGTVKKYLFDATRRMRSQLEDIRT